MPQKRVLGPSTPQLGALGRAVEIHRKRAGLSQEDLAARCGLKATHISLLERGQRNSTYNSLLRVVGALGTTVGALTTLADELYETHPRSEGRE